MIDIVKRAKNMSSNELLQEARRTKEEGIIHYLNNGSIDDRKVKFFEKVEKLTYWLAVKKASCEEELEECAVAIETNCYYDNADDWAEQIRIQAYGL